MTCVSASDIAERCYVEWHCTCGHEDCKGEALMPPESDDCDQQEGLRREDTHDPRLLRAINVDAFLKIIGVAGAAGRIPSMAVPWRRREAFLLAPLAEALLTRHV